MIVTNSYSEIKCCYLYLHIHVLLYYVDFTLMFYLMKAFIPSYQESQIHRVQTNDDVLSLDNNKYWALLGGI